MHALCGKRKNLEYVYVYHIVCRASSTQRETWTQPQQLHATPVSVQNTTSILTSGPVGYISIIPISVHHVCAVEHRTGSAAAVAMRLPLSSD